jgi:hypothetical protein
VIIRPRQIHGGREPAYVPQRARPRRRFAYKSDGGLLLEPEPADPESQPPGSTIRHRAVYFTFQGSRTFEISGSHSPFPVRGSLNGDGAPTHNGQEVCVTIIALKTQCAGTVFTMSINNKRYRIEREHRDSLVLKSGWTSRIRPNQPTAAFRS